MELEEALAALEAAGTAQNRKVYRRHGELSCKTPDAAAHSEKAAAKKRAKRGR